MQDDSRDRSSGPSSTENIAARIQSLRNILSSPRHTTAEQRLALDALDREEADRNRIMEREVNSPTSTIPRPFNDEGYWEPHGSTSPASLARERRRGFRPSARLERQRDRMARLARSDSLEHVPLSTSGNSPLNAGRTRPASPDPETMSPRLANGRFTRNVKRRKLDDGTSDENHRLPEYGLEGTLLPGNLQMAVLDTGNPNDALPQTDELAKQNLYLADNNLIFRSKRRRYNVLMKHKGGWPFNLSKLVIKLPKHDYETAPLQGMVFVSMEGEKLMEKTSYYDSLVPACYLLHLPRRYDSYRPSQEYFRSGRPPPPPLPRTRPVSRSQDAQWCEGHLPEEPAELEQVDGFEVAIERLPEHEETSTSPRSPRPWHDPDHEYSRRQYALRADTYRPSYASDERSRRYRPAIAIPEQGPERTSPTPSDSDDEETPLYRGVPQSQRELEEAEYRQRNILEQMRARRDRGDSYAYVHASSARYDDDGNLMPPDHDYRAPSVGSAASPNAPFGYSVEHTSTKRLPGCNEMLRGRSATADAEDSDREILPHAKFQVSRDGGGVALNFEPAMYARA